MEDILINTTERFAIGIDHASGRYYLSIPVSNRLVDYEEYYAISEAEFRALTGDAVLATRFAAECRARGRDDRLMFAPGDDRGA